MVPGTVSGFSAADVATEVPGSVESEESEESVEQAPRRLPERVAVTARSATAVVRLRVVVRVYLRAFILPTVRGGTTLVCMSSDTNAPTDSVLIAFDGSDQAKAAIRYAARLLSTHKAYIITAWEPIHRQAARAAGVGGLATGGQGVNEDPSDYSTDPAYIDATEISHAGVALAAELGFETEPYLVESSTAVWSAIVEASQELDVDLIVAGTRALSGWQSLLHSSVADNLVKHAGVPVLVVPPLDEPLQ